MAEQKSPRKILSLEVSAEADVALKETAKRVGMAKLEMGSRVILWFAAQPDIVQKTVLGLLPEGMELDVLELWVKQRRAEGKSSPSQDHLANSSPGEHGKKRRV